MKSFLKMVKLLCLITVITLGKSSMVYAADVLIPTQVTEGIVYDSFYIQPGEQYRFTNTGQEETDVFMGSNKVVTYSLKLYAEKGVLKDEYELEMDGYGGPGISYKETLIVSVDKNSLNPLEIESYGVNIKIEKIEDEVEEKKEIKETIPAGPVNFKFTGWRRWDNGTTLDYKVTNNSKETVKGSYGVIICYPGYDTVERHGYYGETEYRFDNERYYPLEGSILDYTLGPMETKDGQIFSQMGGEQGLAGEDLGKRDGHIRYIVVDLKSEAERKKLQSEMDSMGLGLLDDNTMEENTVLQDWLESNFGVIPTGGQ